MTTTKTKKPMPTRDEFLAGLRRAKERRSLFIDTNEVSGRPRQRQAPDRRFLSGADDPCDFHPGSNFRGRDLLEQVRRLAL